MLKELIDWSTGRPVDQFLLYTRYSILDTVFTIYSMLYTIFLIGGDLNVKNKIKIIEKRIFFN